MSAHYLEMAWNLPFSGHSDFTDVEPLYEFKFFQARGARARNHKASKNEHIFRVLQKVAATKKLFCRNMDYMKNGKKNIWTDRNFCKYF